MSIVLHIERLVIDEALLGGERAGSVRAAIERELAQRLTSRGTADVLRGLGAQHALPPATLPQPTHSREQFGTRIAAAVQQGLGLAAATPDGSATRHG